MKRALIAVSTASMVEQFLKPNIKQLQDLGYKVDVACNFDFGSTISDEVIEKLKSELANNNVDIINVLFSRNPFSKGIFKIYRQLKTLINNEKYDLIHCHAPVSGILTRLAARKSRKNGAKVLYTAHGFHFFKGAPLKNWLIYYPTEKFCSRFTDILITMNKEDYNLAKRKMKANKIEYIPGIGVDTEKYKNICVDKLNKRRELGLSDDDIMLLSVGELIKRKNHEVAIRSVAKLKNENIKYFIAGIGDLYEYLIELIHEQGLENQVFLLGYRTDIGELCSVSDMFIFPSLQEGLPVALMEAMAVGLPCVASRTRGNSDLIEDCKGGFLVSPKKPSDFTNAITKLLINENLRCQVGDYSKTIMQNFNIAKVDKKMRGVYERIRNSRHSI